MGNTPQVLRNNGLKRNSNLLLNIKLPKLRDYFASFKSICDNFSIDLTEFEHIFGAGESVFVIWDTDNNGLIDSLQLFSGIAIFSEAKLEDKIRFLFDVFDFNEVQYLEQVQLQFLMHCSISASYKIFGINSDIPNQDIQDFVKDNFLDCNRVTVADLIKKSKQNKKIQDFFEAIKADSTFSKKQNINGKTQQAIMESKE